MNINPIKLSPILKDRGWIPKQLVEVLAMTTFIKKF